jgi:hypothetical protein
MKFRMAHLGYRQSPDYPWDYRIELIEYGIEERERLTEWLNDNNIKHVTAGRATAVIYMQARDANLFAMRWA